MPTPRTASAGVLVDQIFLEFSGPGEKTEKIIFIREHIVRHHLRPHIQCRSVARAIPEVSAAIESCEVLTHFSPLFPYNEKGALFCEMAMGHDGVPFVFHGRSVSLSG